MKIFYQEAENDCGISVTRSLIHHFFNREITRTELSDQLSLSPKGISIFELETLNRKYGIHLEGYQLSIEELQKLDIKDFFVVLLFRNNQEHFAIAKKNKGGVTLYDSELGRFSLNYQRLGTIFSGKILLIEKVDTKENLPLVVSTSKEFSALQLPKLWRNTLLELTVFLFLVISFSINSLIFRETLQDSNLGNIPSIIFITFLLISAWTLAEYIKEIYYLKDKQWYTKYLYQVLLEKLEAKKNYFFSKLPKNQLLMVGQYISNLSTFYGELLSSLIANVVISLCLTIYLVYLHIWFLALIALLVSIKALNYFISKRLDLLQLSLSWKNNISIQKTLFTLNHFTKHEWNYQGLLSLTSSLREEVGKYQLEDKVFQTRKILFSKANFFLTNGLNISIYIVGCYLYFHRSLTAASLILSGVVFVQFNSSIEKLFHISLQWAKSLSSMKQFKLFLFNDNYSEEKKVEVGLPSSIELRDLNYHNGRKDVFESFNLTIFPNTFLTGSSGIGKSTLYRLIASKLPDCTSSIFFDGVAIEDISEECFNRLVIYQNSKTEPRDFDWSRLSSYLLPDQVDVVRKLTAELGIYIGSQEQKFSEGQRQFVNLLSLLQYSNKLFLLDEVSSHINREIKEKIYQKLFPIFSSRNFLICCEHDLSLKKYFPNHLNLDQLLGK
ncbi:ABC transporter ATP binding protein [Candidatus Mycoplasma haematolamae str. Purdue]|uniref:ABC transporter ATP binding protein n=1 Tax=Mycoplasma haematolamae (strain Purdue) TaxID=1212765 RepID=I7BB03_MYCHA|nr:cysteine peptidase family C39 domain-containing protein [Candidatus Mycoplasma haematolamae]AFO52470.1 ABC transporter ATP binding protein [Candidatus Mycoplasma haematolamae str. Purdue]